MYEEQIDVGMQIRRAGWIFEACKCQWEQRTGGKGGLMRIVMCGVVIKVNRVG